jgi:hypothetical protein
MNPRNEAVYQRALEGAIGEIARARALVPSGSGRAKALAFSAGNLRRLLGLVRVSEYARTGAMASRYVPERVRFPEHCAACATCQAAVDRHHHLSDEGGGDFTGLCAEGRRLRLDALRGNWEKSMARRRQRPASGY